jgi:hypothetical protein
LPSNNLSARETQAGVTLIELIVFIVVISVSVSGIMLALSAAQGGATITPAQLTRATQMAQERMDLIIGHKQNLSFACFGDTTEPRYDPCQAAGAAGACPAQFASALGGCAAVPGYPVMPALAGDWGGDTDYRVVTVRVTGPDGGQLAEISALVASY